MKPGDAGNDRTGRRAVALCLAFVCALTLIAYSRSFHSAFHLDDYSQIVGNPVMATPGVQSVLHFGRARIIPFTTLVANYQLGGEEPFGFHLVNFAVHLLATFAVFALALALCRTPRLRGTRLAEQPLVFATAAAFVFACHPIQIQAVTYIVQRMSSMAALFYVGSVFLYVRARNAQIERGPSYAALAFAAFLSKENAASLPVAILLVELAFFPANGAHAGWFACCRSRRSSSRFRSSGRPSDAARTYRRGSACPWGGRSKMWSRCSSIAPAAAPRSRAPTTSSPRRP